jgi:hypothetical protein
MSGRGRKFINRLILSLLGIAWIAGVSSYWSFNAPLLPTTTLPASDSHQFLGINRDGVLVLGQQGESSGEGEPSVVTGPVRYWDPIKSQFEQEVLTKDDRILGTHFGERDLAAIEKNGNLSIVELPTGRVLFSRPSDGKRRRVHFSPDQRLVIFQTDHQILICEIDGGKVVHEETDNEHPLWADFVGDSLVSVARNLGPNSAHGSIQTKYWNSRSWMPDERLSGRHVLHVSPDNRFVVTFNPDFHSGPLDKSIFDLQRGEFIPAPPEGFDGLFGTSFSPDGSELIRLTGTRWHVDIARWRIADQKTIQPVRNAQDDGYGDISKDGRFVVFHPFRLSRLLDFPVPDGVVDFLKRLGIQRPVGLSSYENVVVIAEAATGRVFGVIDQLDANQPNGVTESTAVAPQGIVMYGSSTNGRHNIATRFFTVPPRQNWISLILWLSLPPLILFGAIQLLGRLNKQSSPAKK